MFTSGVFWFRAACNDFGNESEYIRSLCPAAETASNPAQETGPAAAGTGEATRGADYKHTLKWSTASEVNNFGYDVYRSTNKAGPFKRITEQPVPGAGTTDSPSYYQFVDATIDPREIYYYYIESISLDGVREKFTPIQQAPPKLPTGSVEPQQSK